MSGAVKEAIERISPYDMRGRSLSYRKESLHAAGTKSVTEFLVSGEFSLTQKYILELFFELGEMTANIVRDAMQNPEIPDEAKKTSKKGGNPYEYDIRKLCSYGLLGTSRFVAADGMNRQKIYFLAQASKRAFHSAPPAHPVFIKGSGGRIRTPEELSSVKEVCEHLSTVNLFVNFISNNHEEILSSRLYYRDGPAAADALLEFKDGRKAFIVSLREMGAEDREKAASVTMSADFKKDRDSVFYVVPDNNASSVWLTPLQSDQRTSGIAYYFYTDYLIHIGARKMVLRSDSNSYHIIGGLSEEEIEENSSVIRY